jgi:hypothetical protein
MHNVPSFSASPPVKPRTSHAVALNQIVEEPKPVVPAMATTAATVMNSATSVIANGIPPATASQPVVTSTAPVVGATAVIVQLQSST